MTPASPLPWRIGGWNESEEHVFDASGNPVHLPGNAGYAVHAANCYPNLLAALKALWTEVQLSGNHVAHDYGWPNACELTVEAIAKAEGR